jgi:hypothetical protein
MDLSPQAGSQLKNSLAGLQGDWVLACPQIAVFKPMPVFLFPLF